MIKSIQTPRLLLRELEFSDTTAFARVLDNLAVTKYQIPFSHPYTTNQASEFIAEYIQETRIKPRKVYIWGIELKSDSGGQELDEQESDKPNSNGIIGVVGSVERKNILGVAEIGFWLDEQYWRQGIMTEAARAYIEFAFNMVGLRRLEAGAFRENIASKRLLTRKLDFKPEGMKREGVKSGATGKIHDQSIYGLLKRGWEKG